MSPYGCHREIHVGMRLVSPSRHSAAAHSTHIKFYYHFSVASRRHHRLFAILSNPDNGGDDSSAVQCGVTFCFGCISSEILSIDTLEIGLVTSIRIRPSHSSR